MPADLLLVNPYFIREDPITNQAMDIYPLLGHGYLASYLQARGRRVELLDTTFENDWSSYLNALDSTKPAMVGIYGHLVSRSNAFRFAKAAKERGLFTVAGGPDATGYYEAYLENGFDVIVRSEGEVTSSELLDWRDSGADRSDLQKIQGIAYRNPDGRVIVNDLRPFLTNLDALPFPRRDRHIYDPYLNAWRDRHGYVSIHLFAARGCPYDCAFCYRPVFGRNYRRRSPENIVSEIETCVKEFGATHFRFVDDTFVVHKPWVRELATLIQQRKLNVTFDVLARTNLIDDDTASDLRMMGVRRVYLGMESGSDQVLQRMSKRATVADTIKAADVLRKHGMEFLSWIMLGYPGEEKSDIYMTRDMLVQVKPDILSISVAFPIRGTGFHDEVEDRIDEKRPFWKRTGENRMVWQGRYPDLFYSFARRWLYDEVQLAKGTYRGAARPLRILLKWAYRTGMEAVALVHSFRSERSLSKAPESLPPAADNLSNRVQGGKPYV
jgi:anaerobic magnesium-protoporphyrin IX monomethyl ester cyclase